MECNFRFYEREHAIAAVNYLSGMKVDERAVKLDIDQGFTEGRQYGRGRSGGQVRDEVRTDFDYGRGTVFTDGKQYDHCFRLIQ